MSINWAAVLLTDGRYPTQSGTKLLNYQEAELGLAIYRGNYAFRTAAYQRYLEGKFVCSLILSLFDV